MPGGPVHNVLGVNNGPGPYRPDLGSGNAQTGGINPSAGGMAAFADVSTVSSLYASMAVPGVRPNDLGGPFDLRCMFPIANVSDIPPADSTFEDIRSDPRWNFTASDEVFADLLENGFAPYLKLASREWTSGLSTGFSYVGEDGVPVYVVPPQDIAGFCSDWPYIAPVMESIGDQLILTIVERYNNESMWRERMAGSLEGPPLEAETWASVTGATVGVELQNGGSRCCDRCCWLTCARKPFRLSPPARSLAHSLTSQSTTSCSACRPAPAIPRHTRDGWKTVVVRRTSWPETSGLDRRVPARPATLSLALTRATRFARSPATSTVPSIGTARQRQRTDRSCRRRSRSRRGSRTCASADPRLAPADRLGSPTHRGICRRWVSDRLTNPPALLTPQFLPLPSTSFQGGAAFDWIADFLDTVASASSSSGVELLDWFSWHAYTNCIPGLGTRGCNATSVDCSDANPGSMLGIAKQIRTLLDSKGFNRTAMVGIDLVRRPLARPPARPPSDARSLTRCALRSFSRWSPSTTPRLPPTSATPSPAT